MDARLSSNAIDAAAKTGFIFKRYLIKLLAICAYPLLGYYLIQYAMAGNWLLTVLFCLLLAITVALTIMCRRMETFERQHATYRLLIHAFLAGFAAIMVIQVVVGGNPSRLPWLFVFTVVSFFTLDARWGMIWSTSLLAAMLLGAYHLAPGSPSVSEALNERLFLAALMVIAFSYFAERMRADYHRELTAKLDLLEQSEERYRRAKHLLEEKIVEREQERIRNRDQADFLELIINSLTHPFYVIDTSDYRIRLANTAALNGRNADLATCYRLTHGRDQPCSGTGHPCPLETIVRTREPMTTEHLHYDGRGRRRNVEIHAYPVFNSAGEVAQIIEYAVDVTEQREIQRQLEKSEKRIKTLTDHLEMGVYRIDRAADGKLIEANPALAGMLGYRRHADLLKCGVEDLVQRPEDLTELIEQLNRGEVAKNVEITLKRSDGQRFPASVSAISINDESGKTRYIDGFVENISYRKSLENQIRQSQKMEALGTLAGGIAHDFNNILSAIIGFAELSQEDAKDDPILRDNIDEILLAGKRARDLVSQILAFSRQQEQEYKPLQVGPIVKEALKLLRSTLPTTIDIRSRVQPELGNVYGDPTQIHQIILNLCTNAQHAMQDSGGILKVTLTEEILSGEFLLTQPELSPGRYLRMAVSDAGHGIPPEIIDSIFDPYFTTKEIGDGTGLGLAVAMGIVQSCGGTITVDSSPGIGSTFNVFLPVIERESESLHDAASELPGGIENILYIDDEAALARLGKQRLERLGYHVTTRSSPVEALELFRHDTSRFDLAITDFTMPKMTGDKLATAMMDLRPDFPVILCTGFSGQISEDKARSMGIRAFIMKPIVIKELAATIREVLDHSAPGVN